MNRSVVLIGRSAAARLIDEEIETAARCRAKVLITGESGVGKEIVATLIHRRSDRAAAPMVAINCAGVPDSLLESEMFGHVRGAFTDAHRDKRGWLEQAHGGTIFMDEVGEMSLRMQAALLRFLETGEIQRVGSDQRLPPVDVRVIAATHRNLIEEIGGNSFREDLYYRLNVIHIAVPPLRERADDIPVLIDHFLGLSATANRIATPPTIADDAMQSLQAYRWPGNIRELRNVVERLVLRYAEQTVTVDALPMEFRERPAAAAAATTASALRKCDVLFDRMINGGEPFWSAVYDPFMARDLTRREVRDVVRLGLERTRGNYKALVRSFNLPPGEYKRFLNFLRKFECQVAFQQYRMPVRQALPRPRPGGDA